jgi:hypothetical protein
LFDAGEKGLASVALKALAEKNAPSNTPELPGGTTAKAAIDEPEARSRDQKPEDRGQRTDWYVVCDEW